MRRGSTTCRGAILILALWAGGVATCRGQDEPPPPAPPADNVDSESSPATDPPADAPDEAREAIVLLNDGQKVTGQFVEQTAEHVVLLVSNIRMELPAERVLKVDIQPTVAERYHAMRQMIPPKDLEQRLLLARWLLDKEKYDWALTEVEGVLDEDPASLDAQRLRKLIVNQLALRNRSGQQKPAATPTVERSQKFQFPLLTSDQINLMKVYEVDLANPPRLIVPREAIDRLIAENAGSDLLPRTAEGRSALYRRPGAEILDLMFRLRARSLYGMVKVQDQPRSMQRFRDDVLTTWLINSCATDRCHGGAEAGRLRLYNRKPASDPTIYTNFLILDRFRLSDGQPLINCEAPAKSPLLQMALSRGNSAYPHPPVSGSTGKGDLWKPAISSTDDKRFDKAIAWIDALYKPRPEYPVEYEPPSSAVPHTDAAGPPR